MQAPAGRFVVSLADEVTNRSQLREIEGKSPKEQLTALSQLLQEYAEFFLTEAGTGMDDAMRQRDTDIDARCGERAA